MARLGHVRSDDPGTLDCVKISGASGDQIRVRVVVSSGTWNPVTDVTAADGSTVCSITFADEFTCTLTTGGNHAIFVRDGAGTGSATGQARFFLQRLNNPVGCKPLPPGSERQDRRDRDGRGDRLLQPHRERG